MESALASAWILPVRRLLKAKGFSAAVMLTLALGLGANAAVFSLVDQVLWRPLPYPDPGQLVLAQETRLDGGPANGNLSALTFLDLRAQTTAFTGLAGYRAWNVNLGGDRQPEVLKGAKVSGNFFELLGVRAQAGRLLRSDEEASGTARTVVLSHAFWTRRFGGDPAVVGRTLRLDGEPWEVAGILPPDFTFPHRLGQPDLFIPFTFPPETLRPEARGHHFFHAFGRLKPGLTPSQGSQDLARVMAGLARTYPDSTRGATAVARPLREATWTPKRRDQLRLLALASGLVLIIACLNAANLMMVRGLARRQETALRASLGASRARLLRELLTESAWLAGGASVLGGLFSWIMAQGLLAVVNLPEGVRASLDLRTLLFLALLAVATCLMAGGLPAWMATGGRLAEALKDGSKGTATRTTHRLRAGMVAGQVALATVLLTSSGFLLRELWRLQARPLGFDPRPVLTAGFFPPASTHDAARIERFVHDLAQRLEGEPSVEAAALSDSLPLSGFTTTMDLVLEGDLPGTGLAPRPVMIHRATPGLPGALDLKLRAGRDLAWSDRDTCLISTRLAGTHFPGENPLGRRLRINDGPWMHVVGVVDEAMHHGPGQAPLPQVYLPLREFTGPVQVAVRMKVKPEGFTSRLSALAADLDADLPATRILPMSALADQILLTERSQGFLLITFALIALFLSVVGLYGLMSHVARGRTRELGIRAAMGATFRDLVALLVGQGLRLAALGAGAGLALGAAFPSLLRAQGAAPPAADSPVILATLLLVGVTTLLASLLPSIRAARIQPAVALRSE